MRDIEGLSAEYVVQIFMHMDGQQILSQATLVPKVEYLCEQASEAILTGTGGTVPRVDINERAVLETLSLAVSRRSAP